MRTQINHNLKRLLSICIVLALLLSTIGSHGTIVYAAETSFETATFSLNSNTVNDESVDLYVKDSVHYILIEDLCKLVRCSWTQKDDVIWVTQGFWSSTFNVKDQVFDDGYQTVDITVLEVAPNKYAIPALMFLNYFKAAAFIENDTLYCEMPEFTAWEALNVDYANTLVDIYELYGGEGNVILSLTLDIIMDFIMGDMSTSEDYLSDAFLTALKVDLYDYDSVQKYKETSQGKLYSFLHSDKGEEFVEAVDDVLSVSAEPTQWYIQYYYNAIEKSFVSLAYDAFEAGQHTDVTHYGEKFYEAFTEKNKTSETAEKYFDNADYVMLFVSAAVDTAQQMKYTKATDNLIYNVMGQDNLNYLGITPSEDNGWFTVANRYKNVLGVAATQLEAEAMQLFTDKLCWETLIGTGVSSAAGISGGAWTFSLNFARLFVEKFPLTSSSVETFKADRRALYLSELQQNVYWVALNTLQDMQGQWDNPEIYAKYIQALQLYCRTSIAMYENLITMVDEFGQNSDYWTGLFQDRIDMLAVSLYQLTTLQDDGVNMCLPLELKSFSSKATDPSNLVTDAYTDAIVDGEWIYCYHIPQVNLSDNRGDAFNAKIYDHFNNLLTNDVYQSMEEYDYPYLSEIVYTWGQKDNLVSVVVQADQTMYSWTDFYVYTISVETGEEISYIELLAAYDLSEADFYNLVKETLTEYWDSRKSDMISFVGEDYYNTLVERTLAEENVKDAIPYINSNGELCFVAYIYSAAGADKYLHLLNTAGTADEGWVECTLDHFAEETETDTSDYLDSLCTKIGLTPDAAKSIVDIYVPFCKNLSGTYTSSDGGVAEQRSCLVVDFAPDIPNLVVHYWVPNAYSPGQFCEVWIIYGIENGKVVELYCDENYAPTRREINMVYDENYRFALREEQTGGYYELIIHYPENVTDVLIYESYSYIQMPDDGHTLRVWKITGDYIDISY